MNYLSKHSFTGMLALAVLGLSLNISSATPPTEASLIASLASPKEGTVIDALQSLEKNYPLSTNAFPTMKKLLTDPRIKVQRKTARVLGVLHAPVDESDIKSICELLKSTDTSTITDGLKALRGLDAPSAVPDIVPLLNHPKSHIVRDACRTLAVIGNKDLIPKIEPLLKSPDPAVEKDAQDAIVALKAKP